MPIKKVDVRDLVKGMYVAKLDRPWADSPFLFQGFRIETEDDLAKLRKHCRFVGIDPELGYDGPKIKEHAVPDRKLTMEVERRQVKRPPGDLTPQEPNFNKALSQAYQYRRRATDFLGNVLETIREGKAVDTTRALTVVEGLTRSVKLNVNASVWLNALKQRHEHSATHCTNVSVVALAFAHTLGYEGQKLIDVGVGALLHDAGLMRMDVKVLEKPGRLTQQEEKELREHPISGLKMLLRNGELSPTVANIIRYHHERYDGSGYPEGISGEKIPEEAMVVALADVYDAMTTARPYKTAGSPHSSMTTLKRLADSQFKPKLVQQFMSCIGIYPISSVVQLNNGSIAMVVGHTRHTRIRPEVMLLKNRKGQTYRNWPLLDIDARSNQPDGEQWQIMRVVEPADYGIDVGRVTEAYVDRLYGSSDKAESA